jgi:hypothetical protein
MNGARIAGSQYRSSSARFSVLTGGVASTSAVDHRATRDAKWQPCCRERAYSWNAVLHIHRADRADHLAGALAGVLNEPLADPFAAEVVAVPTRGVERGSPSSSPVRWASASAPTAFAPMSSSRRRDSWSTRSSG